VLGTISPMMIGCEGADVPEATEADATAQAGRFEIFVAQDAQYYFQLVAGNNQRVLRSEGYTKLSSAKKGVKSVQANGVDKANYKVLEAVNGEFYFNLVAQNGQIIGT